MRARDEKGETSTGHVETELEKQEREMMLAKRRFMTRNFIYSSKEKQIFKNREEKVKHGKKMRDRESMIMRLKQKVNFTVEDLQNVIKGFKDADTDESKRIDYAEFTKAMGTILGDDIFDNFGDGKSKDYFGQVFFQAFDTNNSGLIDFGEMCMGLSAYLDGTMSERLNFLFRVYDVNGDGKISRGEVATMLKHQWNHVLAHQEAYKQELEGKDDDVEEKNSVSLFRKNTAVAHHLVEYGSFEDYLKKSIERFDSLDQDGDRKIDLKEFTDGIQHDDSLFELFATDMFLLPKDTQNGSSSHVPSASFVDVKIKTLEDAQQNPIVLHNQILLYMKVLEVQVSKKNRMSMIDVTRTIDSLFGERVLKSGFHQEFSRDLKQLAGETNTTADFNEIVDKFLPAQIEKGIKFCKAHYLSADSKDNAEGEGERDDQQDGETADETVNTKDENETRLLSKREQMAN